MKRLLSAVILLSVAVTGSLAAQSIGGLFPVTNTRYRTAYGLPHLATNGQDFFLFWTSNRKVRATQLSDGQPRAGHVVLDSSGGFDVAWTGEHFLVVSTSDPTPNSDDKDVVVRFLDAETQPIDAQRTIAEHGFLPRVASGPEAALVVYHSTGNDVRALPLAADGASIGATSSIIATSATGHAVAGNSAGFVAAVADRTEMRAVAFDAHGQKIADRTLVHRDAFYREVSIATDGTRYVAVWTEENAVMAATIDANGNWGTPLLVDSTFRFPRTPTVIWNGAGWTISFDGPAFGIAARAHIAHLDVAAQRIVSSEETAEGFGSPSVAALNGRIVAALAPANYAPGGISVVDLPLASNQGRIATFSATQQQLAGTATSVNGTLIIWSETSDGNLSLHAGLRTNDGRWSEREIATLASTFSRVAVASDGRNFAIGYYEQTGSKLIRLDEDGQVLGRSILPLYPAAMAWNGSQYAIIDSSTNRGALLSASGVLSAPVEIPGLIFDANSLASDGHGHLLALGGIMDCQFELCFPLGVAGTRLGPNLERLDPSDFILTEDFVELAGAVWNGTEYVTAWGGDDGNRLARIPPTPEGSIKVSTLNVPLRPQGIAMMTDGSIGLVGRSPEADAPHAGIVRVAILRNDGAVANTFDIETATNLMAIPRLAPLANGGLAYLSSSIQDPAPHHGTTHVMMAIARPSLPPLPGAPYVRARLDSGQIEVDWAPPAGTFNGYRLEYRVDNGSWNEIDQWFSPNATHASIQQPSFGTNFAIRLRAFNDSGAGAYSAAAVTKPSRRRAVR
ncbi:MAG TPA: fibronectin type III domain-containing protein [Thermoanaerobaculia bacterium]